MKFRKRPIVIEAELFHPEGPTIEGVSFKLEGFGSSKIKTFYIKTLEGDMEVKAGDWVITGVNGEKYPCKPDIFEKTYERVEE